MKFVQTQKLIIKQEPPFKDQSTQTFINPVCFLESEGQIPGLKAEEYETFKVFNPKTGHLNLNFRCLYNNCGMEFKKSCNLKSHLRKHNGQKPYICQICLKIFSHCANLFLHLKNRHNLNDQEAQEYKVNSMQQAKYLSQLKIEDRQFQ